MLRILVVIYLWCFSAFLNAVAQEPVELVTSMDFPPFITDEYEAGGLFTEIVRESIKAGGGVLQIKIMPWKRAHRSLETGEITGTFSWAYTREREELFLLSNPIFKSTALFVTNIENFNFPNTFYEKHSLEQTLVQCSPLGWTVPSYAREFKEKGILNLSYPPKLSSCFQLLANGRIDVLFLQRMVVAHQLTKSSEEVQNWNNFHINIAPMDLYGGGTHVLFSKTKAGQKAQRILNTGLKAIVSNGVYHEVVQKYLKDMPLDMQKNVWDELVKHEIIPNIPSEVR